MDNSAYTNFEANLKIASGEVVSNGFATVNLQKREINFASDYVPIYKPGSPMEIVRVFQGDEIHKFFGKVSISNRKMLRLANVNDLLLEGSEQFYSNNIQLKATTTISRVQHQNWLKKFLRLLANTRTMNINVHLSDITYDSLTFAFHSKILRHKKGFYQRTSVPDDYEDLELQEGDSFTLNVTDKFPVKQIPVQISKVLHFGNHSNFRCDITDPAVVNTLKSYLTAFHMENNMCFKDV